MTRDDFKSLLGNPLSQGAELLCYLEAGSWHICPLEVSLGSEDHSVLISGLNGTSPGMAFRTGVLLFLLRLERTAPLQASF